jgi:hypothetical protein
VVVGGREGRFRERKERGEDGLADRRGSALSTEKEARATHLDDHVLENPIALNGRVIFLIFGGSNLGLERAGREPLWQVKEDRGALLAIDLV